MNTLRNTMNTRIGGAKFLGARLHMQPYSAQLSLKFAGLQYKLAS